MSSLFSHSIRNRIISVCFWVFFFCFVLFFCEFSLLSPLCELKGLSKICDVWRGERGFWLASNSLYSRLDWAAMATLTRAADIWQLPAHSTTFTTSETTSLHYVWCIRNGNLFFSWLWCHSPLLQKPWIKNKCLLHACWIVVDFFPFFLFNSRLDRL